MRRPAVPRQSEDVAAELADRNSPAPTVVELEDAGHELGFAVPGAGGAGEDLDGRYPEATGLGRARAWQGVLDYLAAL